MGADFGFIWKNAESPALRAFARLSAVLTTRASSRLAHGLSLRLSPNSDAGSRPQRPVALAFGELLPQPLCGR